MFAAKFCVEWMDGCQSEVRCRGKKQEIVLVNAAAAVDENDDEDEPSSDALSLKRY